MLNTMAPGTVRLRVSELLKERGMSTAEFAEKAGFAYNTALALVRDSYDKIGKDTLARICEVLDVEPGDVIVIDPAPAKKTEPE
jgi:putative transcriptional regulator